MLIERETYLRNGCDKVTERVSFTPAPTQLRQARLHPGVSRCEFDVTSELCLSVGQPLHRIGCDRHGSEVDTCDDSLTHLGLRLRSQDLVFLASALRKQLFFSVEFTPEGPSSPWGGLPF